MRWRSRFDALAAAVRCAGDARKELARLKELFAIHGPARGECEAKSGHERLTAEERARRIVVDLGQEVESMTAPSIHSAPHRIVVERWPRTKTRIGQLKRFCAYWCCRCYWW